MLSGDIRRTADAVAKEAEIERVAAEVCRPGRPRTSPGSSARGTRQGSSATASTTQGISPWTLAAPAHGGRLARRHAPPSRSTPTMGASVFAREPFQARERVLVLRARRRLADGVQFGGTIGGLLPDVGDDLIALGARGDLLRLSRQRVERGACG